MNDKFIEQIAEIYLKLPKEVKEELTFYEYLLFKSHQGENSYEN